MKFLATLLFSSLLAFNGYGQAQYEISQDEKHPEVKVLRGIVNKYLVQNDTAFRWYTQSQGYYNPDTATLNAFERTKGKVQYVVFGGTWCEDTQFIIPKFFKIQEKSGVPDDAVTFFGVNRAKRSLGSISSAFNVTLVPTIIVMKDGKEIGRVVEYGKTGKWDKELVDILNQ
ncbi:MAG: thioredoxin family protein [Chitinophagaceae bacterium]|nr:thioredoxin family protein [Chitinophagaceae bacterium]